MVRKRTRAAKPSSNGNGRHADGVGAGREKDEAEHDEQFIRSEGRTDALIKPHAKYLNPGPTPKIGRRQHNRAVILWLGYAEWLRLRLRQRVDRGRKKYRNDLLTPMHVLLCEIVYWLRPPTHDYVRKEDIGKPRAAKALRHRTSDGRWWIVCQPSKWAKKYALPSRWFAIRLIGRWVELA